MLRMHVRTTTPLSSFITSKQLLPAVDTRAKLAYPVQRKPLCRALQIDPGNFVLLSNRSAAYMGLEDFELALQDATACVEANPEFVKGYNRQAQAHVMLHQPGLAEAAYRNGLALDSDNPVLRQGLTQLLKVSIIATQASIVQPLGLCLQQRLADGLLLLEFHFQSSSHLTLMIML